MAEIESGLKLDDTNSSNPKVPSRNFPLGLILEIVIFLISFENVLSLLTLRLFKKWKAVDLLVLSLSLADFLNATLPLQVLNVKANFVSTSWSAWLCGLFVWTTYTLRIASSSTVTLMSIEQALLLYKPLRYHTQMTPSFMRKLVLLTWGISAVTPAFTFVLAVTSSNRESPQCRYQPFHLGVGFGIFIEALGFIQFAIVFGSYVTLVYSSKGFHRRQRMMVAWGQNNQTGRDRRADHRLNDQWLVQKRNFRQETQGMLQVRQLCRGMAYVVFLYYVSWLPFLVYNLYNLLTRSTVYNRQMNIIVGICTLISPVMNPFLYIKMVSRYKKGVFFILKRAVLISSRKRTLSNSKGKRLCFSLECQLNSYSSRNTYNFAISSAKISTISLVNMCELETTSQVDSSDRTSGRMGNVRNNKQNCGHIALGNISEAGI